MKILITAGGTCEQIDNVRSITNTSTGKLGCLIADAFASSGAAERIEYVCSRKAALPQSEKAVVHFVDDVASLENEIRSLLEQSPMDIIVHSMAVSDYRMRSVTSASLLADWIVNNPEALKNLSLYNGAELVSGWFESADSLVGKSGKISSNVDNMILLMERTPKIISLFQSLSPQSVLVGFKLLDSVPRETLIDTAYGLLQDNRCSFVLANDLAEISEDQHVGYLLDEERSCQKYRTKQEIAAAIVAATIEKRSKR